MYIYYNNDNYVTGYGSEPEEFSIQIDSIPEEVDRYLGCYKFKIVGNTIKYFPDEKRIAWKEQQNINEKEMVQLEIWFKWYDEQCIQYQRALFQGKEFDKNISELHTQADENAVRIKELRKILSTPYSANENSN